MQTEYLVVHNRGEGQVVEQVCVHLPHVSTPVLANTFIIKAIAVKDDKEFR
jgi:hypothetical protein